MSRPSAIVPTDERVALKDERLVYRACSLAFARSLGFASPEQVIGKTDFDLLPNEIAREQMALDSRIMYLAQADIGTIELGGTGGSRQVMIVRTPIITAARKVLGIDIRLLGKPDESAADGGEPAGEGALGERFGPAAPGRRVGSNGAAEGERDASDADRGSVDLVTLVNDGIQGSLIFSGDAVLFANDNAAGVLGFDGAERLIAQGRVSELFEPEEVARIAATVAGAASEESRRRSAGRLTLTARTLEAHDVRLIARAADVDWGARRATLLSFVDVALPSNEVPDLGAMAELTAASCIGGPDVVVKRLPDGRGAPETDLAHHDPAANLHQLQVNEQRFRHYASSAADFFWELDANLVFRVVSDDIEKVLGISGEQMVGRTHRQLSERLADASDPDHWREHLDSLDRHEQFRDVEFRRSVEGETRVIRYSGLPLFDRERRFVGYRGVGGDVTAAVRQAEAVAYHADHDALTSLLNRRRFESMLNEALETSRTGRESHALCFMDLDRFKVVNDTCGHQAGDELLRQLARLLDSLVRKSDVLARLGGDEFGVLLYECDVAGALKLANQIRAEVESFEFLWEGKRFTIGVSVGLVVIDGRWEDAESLFSAADSACYIAKNEGRNRVVVHRETEGATSKRKSGTHWVDEIDAALAEGRMQLACQPILPLDMSAAEAEASGARLEMLLRLRLPDGDIVAPPAFLPAAERHGLSAALDERAVELALEWLAASPDRASTVRQVSINLASGSFTDAHFAERLIGCVERSGVAAGTLCFELSETATIAHLAKASEFMRRLAAVGCRFGIDDFGSSLSSFTWMRELPIDFVKIDGRLVKDILDDPIDLTTVRAIGDISRSMGTRTVAGFVESSELLEAVREIGIDFAQGFHVGKPELIEWRERQLTH